MAGPILSTGVWPRYSAAVVVRLHSSVLAVTIPIPRGDAQIAKLMPLRGLAVSGPVPTAWGGSTLLLVTAVLSVPC